jgi:hypothetical protein
LHDSLFGCSSSPLNFMHPSIVPAGNSAVACWLLPAGLKKCASARLFAASRGTHGHQRTTTPRSLRSTRALAVSPIPTRRKVGTFCGFARWSCSSQRWCTRSTWWPTSVHSTSHTWIEMPHSGRRSLTTGWVGSTIATGRPTAVALGAESQATKPASPRYKPWSSTLTDS